MTKQRGAYGDGSVFLRGSIYHYQFYSETGEKRQGSTGRRIEAEAWAELRELQRKDRTGRLEKPLRGETVAELLRSYYASCVKDGNAPGTTTTYLSQINLHLIPFFGAMPIDRVTAQDILAYRAKREVSASKCGSNRKVPERCRRVVTPTTINRELAVLRAAMREKVQLSPQAIPMLPYFTMADESRNKRKGFIREKTLIESLLPNMPRHIEALTASAFYCGARLGELTSLDWEQLDFEANLIHFEKTKNGDERDVPIFDGRMRELLLRDRKACGGRGPVFRYNGERLLRLKKSWATATKAANLPNLRFHDLRRSANKWMRDNGIPQAQRMAFLGHKTVSMDLRYGITDIVDIQQARKKARGMAA